MSLLSKVDLSFVQKKVRENPYGAVAVGCGITAITLYYVLSKSSSKDLDDDDDCELPEFVYPDADREFTERFSKHKSRKRGTSDQPYNNIKRQNSRPKPMNNDNINNKNNNTNNDDNFDEKEQKMNVEYSPFDPNNPNYSNDMNNDDIDEVQLLKIPKFL